MNILLVDDDEYIIESVKTLINWSIIGIQEIYTANNVTQAKQIILQIPIQIMLCDIEMHQETGLDLVEWARSIGWTAQVIFLTSYAEFSYAKKAITLNSFDYLLKPIEFKKLEAILLEAVYKVREGEKSREYKEGYITWQNSEPMRKYWFWKNLIYDETLQNNANHLKKALSDMGLYYDFNECFSYIRIEIYDYATIYENLERGMFDFIVTNITNELFSQKGYHVETIFRTDEEESSQWNLILRKEDTTEDRAILESVSLDYIHQIHHNLQSRVGCYIGDSTTLMEIVENIKQVTDMSKNDVLAIDHVCFLKDYQYKDIPYVEPSFSIWEKQLLSLDIEHLIYSVDLYLQNLIRNQGINARNLELFYNDFNQMVHSVLRSKQISMNKLVLENDLVPDQKAFKSIDLMKAYVKKLLKNVSEYMVFVKQEQSVVGIVKDYINSHFGEDLNRDTFARLVYLNPDYLAKLFKKETGSSLGNYLIQKRIEQAKTLLSASNQPVNTISIKIGYSNFSYFSKLFRRETGMTPNEYRKHHTS